MQPTRIRRRVHGFFLIMPSRQLTVRPSAKVSLEGRAQTSLCSALTKHTEEEEKRIAQDIKRGDVMSSEVLARDDAVYVAKRHGLFRRKEEDIYLGGNYSGSQELICNTFKGNRDVLDSHVHVQYDRWNSSCLL